jgi:hypothetical protein
LALESRLSDWASLNIRERFALAGWIKHFVIRFFASDTYRRFSRKVYITREYKANTMTDSVIKPVDSFMRRKEAPPEHIKKHTWGSAPNPGIFGGIAPESNGVKEKASYEVCRKKPSSDVPSAPRRLGYPLSGCVPAEPDSVLPSISNVTVGGYFGNDDMIKNEKQK